MNEHGVGAKQEPPTPQKSYHPKQTNLISPRGQPRSATDPSVQDREGNLHNMTD